MRRGLTLITALVIAAAGCSKGSPATQPSPYGTRTPVPVTSKSPHPTVTPGIEPCAFVTYGGHRYQHDLHRRVTGADVGRALGRPEGDGCGAYSPRHVNAFASRDEAVADVIIVVDNYAPIRYVVQPPDLCRKDALTIALGRRGVYHGRSGRIVLIRNISPSRCTVSSDISLHAVSPRGKRILVTPLAAHPRSPLLPGQALNVLIGSGGGACLDPPQYATLLEVEVGLVTGAYLRRSKVQTNCGTPAIFEIFAEPLN